MTVYEIVILVAMVGYAIFRQTQFHEVVGDTRFKLAIIYGIVGLAMGGYHVPNGRWEIIFLATSLLLSVVVGLVRGKYTRVWADQGRVYSQGTAFTISLFVGLVAVKFTMGTLAYFNGLSDSGRFGEILLMIATMVAFQAQIIWRRAQPLGARTSEKAQPTRSHTTTP
ncbi:hypothetical protein H4P1_00069 (plasmid) [Variovorax sp. PBS-H4]|uniref:DUF1453 family protein n=1 Tax=Variovorax sp. PBS-H4 TaxID=434008 RepID=UPI0013190AC3|nr:DUF1453 family protein [Variovorax sp. PBS-H4]VTU41437.1 hypothetical protein H4P1_00069 [Variovorax sp. PBS-H4]